MDKAFPLPLPQHTPRPEVKEMSEFRGGFEMPGRSQGQGQGPSEVGNRKRTRTGTNVVLAHFMQETLDKGKQKRAEVIKNMKRLRKEARDSKQNIWERHANKNAYSELSKLVSEIQRNKQQKDILKTKLDSILNTIDIKPGETAELPNRFYVKKSLKPTPTCSRTLVSQIHHLWLNLEKKKDIRSSREETEHFMSFMDRCLAYLPEVTFQTELKETKTVAARDEAELLAKEEEKEKKAMQRRAKRSSLGHLFDADGNIVPNVAEAERKLKIDNALAMLERREKARKRPPKKNCIQEFMEKAAAAQAALERAAMSQASQERRHREDQLPLRTSALSLNPTPHLQQFPQQFPQQFQQQQQQTQSGPSGSFRDSRMME